MWYYTALGYTNIHITERQQQRQRKKFQTRMYCVLLHNQNDSLLCFLCVVFFLSLSLSPSVTHFLSPVFFSKTKVNREKCTDWKFGIQRVLHHSEMRMREKLKHLIEQIDDKLLSFLSWFLWANKFLHSKQPTCFCFHSTSLRCSASEFVYIFLPFICWIPNSLKFFKMFVMPSFFFISHRNKLNLYLTHNVTFSQLWIYFRAFFFLFRPFVFCSHKRFVTQLNMRQIKTIPPFQHVLK